MISLISREWYTIAIFGMVVLASILPVGGQPAEVFSVATNLAIALLFFLHGARLSREVVIAGMTHWRLHLFVLVTTFVVFPVLGFIILAVPNLMTPAIRTPDTTLGATQPTSPQLAFGGLALNTFSRRADQ